MPRNYKGTQIKHLGKNHDDFCRGAFNKTDFSFNCLGRCNVKSKYVSGKNFS